MAMAPTTDWQTLRAPLHAGTLRGCAWSGTALGKACPPCPPVQGSMLSPSQFVTATRLPGVNRSLTISCSSRRMWRRRRRRLRGSKYGEMSECQHETACGAACRADALAGGGRMCSQLLTTTSVVFCPVCIWFQ
jgi:hypothetical protein